MGDVVELTCELVRADTRNPGGDERALVRKLKARLERFGPDAVEYAEVPRDLGEIGAWVFARFGTPKTLINVHIDTVPANDGWSRDPHTPVVAGEHVIGLGSADTKGAAAALLCAMEQVAPRDVAVLFSGDEERLGTCMDAFLATELARGIERAVVCEPTSCQAGTRHRGIIAMSARLEGAGGHSSGADHMPAPVAELARLAVALYDWGIAQRGRGPTGFQGMCMNVAALDGGIAVNVVPDRAELSWSLRPGPGVDSAAVHDELVELCRRVVADAEVKTILHNPPFATRDLDGFRPLVGDVVDDPIDMPFWTEAAALSRAGIDAVVLGPGDIRQAHAPDEQVPIADLRRAQNLFESLLRAHR